MAADASSVRAGDERAWRVRRWRRPPRVHEAGGQRRRRGRDVDLPRPSLPGHDVSGTSSDITVEELRGLDILDGLSSAQLEELLEAGLEVPIEPGAELFHEGRHADHWWLLIDGEITLF